MKLIKNFSCILVVVILNFFTVHSQGDLTNLMKQLETAHERLAIAEHALKMRDFDAFTVYKKYPFMPEGLYAEMHLRNDFYKEYSEYIQAKGDLDDIEFMIYIAKLNAISLVGDKS